MKRLILMMLTLLILLVACGKSTEATWQEQYDLGVRYLSEGNYEEAIIAFTAAIEIDPKKPDTYIGLYEAYIGIGDYENAERVLEEGERECGTLGEFDVTQFNAYGGTEFTVRSIFRAYEEMSERERYIVDTVANAAISNTLEDLYDMLDAYTYENDWMHIYTIWNDYKVQMMFCPYSEMYDGKDMGKHIEIEMRSENGMGYYASIYYSYPIVTEGRDYWNDYYYSSLWASCPCKNWQWNGTAQIVDKSNYLWRSSEGAIMDVVYQSTETGTMENSLRSGEFIKKEKDGTIIKMYDEGSLLSATVIIDGNETSVDGDDNNTDGAGLLGTYYGGTDRPQHCYDDLYW